MNYFSGLVQSFIPRELFLPPILFTDNQSERSGGHQIHMDDCIENPHQKNIESERKVIPAPGLYLHFLRHLHMGAVLKLIHRERGCRMNPRHSRGWLDNKCQGEVEKITSIYTHFHFSLANVATYWALLRLCPPSVRRMCMCVPVWYVWTMGRLSLSPSCPNPLWRGWITHLGFFFLAYSFSHSSFLHYQKPETKAGLCFCHLYVCVCVCSLPAPSRSRASLGIM